MTRVLKPRPRKRSKSTLVTVDGAVFDPNTIRFVTERQGARSVTGMGSNCGDPTGTVVIEVNGQVCVLDVHGQIARRIIDSL